MKNFGKIFFAAASAFLLLTACRDKTFEKKTYMANVPVYMPMEVFRSTAVHSENAEPLANSGKIYLKDNFIFINEKYKGVHIIDNTNPQSPQNISFINIPGNVDIAVKENTLYADSYIDLVSIDISNPQSVKVSSRNLDVFPSALPELKDKNYPMANIEKEKGIVVGWELKEVTEVVEVDRGNYYLPYEKNSTASEDVSTLTAFSAGDGISSSGIGGSMASFTVSGNFLYALSGNFNLKVFEILIASTPRNKATVSLNRRAETLFPYQDKLFIGTTTGMLIYDISTPQQPQYLSLFTHSRACDPVVVSGNYAYVTLRVGGPCGGGSNQLDVIDISTITSPKLLKSYPMTEPYGLGIDDSTLFICDGNAGLKVYNASDPNKIDQNLLAQYSSINAYDVIPNKNILMLIGSDGLYQYDYTNPSQMKFLSSLPISNN